MATGAAWMIGMRMCVTALGLVSTLILARLLEPSDFGLVALATALAAALELLTNFRFDVPLIQNQNALREEYDSAWTLNLLMGGALAVLLLIVSRPAASLFDEPRLSSIICALALSSVMDGAQNIGIVNFRKDLEFHKEFAFTTIRKVSSVAVAVAIAWTFRSYWALAAGILTSSAVGLAASFVMHAYRPRPSVAGARQLLAFSKWLMLDNLIQFLRTRSSDLLIGKLAGAGSLGLFNLAQETATLAQATITAPINRALLPGYSRLQDDLESLRNSYLATVGITTLVAVPMAVGIAAVAPLLVPLLLGNHWLGSIPLIELLGIASAISLCGSGAPIIYIALGRPQLSVFQGIADISVLLAGMGILLPRYGATGAAWAMLIAALATLPIRLALARSVLGAVLRRWLGVVWRPALAATAMYLLVTMFSSPPGAAAGAATEISRLSQSVGVGVGAYAGAVIVLWFLAGRPPGAESIVATTARRIFLR
jgi:O-antigen/teichoic acid export membrane protein